MNKKNNEEIMNNQSSVNTSVNQTTLTFSCLKEEAFPKNPCDMPKYIKEYEEEEAKKTTIEKIFAALFRIK